MTGQVIPEEEYSKLPESVRDGIKRYIEHRVEPGGFLMAVLENDLVRSFGKADSNNRQALFSIVGWIYDVAPGSCWGSPEKVKKWLQGKVS